MLKGVNGLPALASIQTYVEGAAGPVDIQFGPDGELYYADFNGGSVKRIHYVSYCPSGQYFAEYYSNMTLSDSPVFPR